MRRFICGLIAAFLFAQPAHAGLTLDGVDDFVPCSSPTALDDIFSGGGTVCVRISRDSNSKYYIMVGQITPATYLGWGLDIGDGDGDTAEDDVVLYQSFNSGGSAYEAQYMDAVPNIDTYYAICVSYDNTNVANEATFSVNGSSFADTSTNPTGAADSGAAQTFYVASRGFDDAFDGNVNEVAVWDRALTATEMNQMTTMMNIVRYAPLHQPANLVAYWPMFDKEGATAANGTTVNDIVGNNDCTPDDGANNTGMLWDWDVLTHP